MKRSKTQVLLHYLPGQVFRHENGTVGKVFAVRTQRSDVNEELVLQVLGDELGGWERKSGFPEPPAGHRDRYEVVEPVDELIFDVWPLTLRCRRPSCQRIMVYDKLEDFLADPHGTRCGRKLDSEESRVCGAPMEQLEFLMVHKCGNLAQLFIPPCPKHGWEWMVLEDTGSFDTAVLRCQAPGCNGKPIVGMLGFRGCGCGDPQDKYMRSLTVRAPNRYMVQRFALVSMERGPIERLRTQQGGDRIALGSYLGLFDDVISALDEARRTQSGVTSEEWAQIEKTLREAHMPDELIAKQRAAALGEAQGKFAEVERLVPEPVLHVLGRRQKTAERALLFGRPHDRHTFRLVDFQRRAHDLGLVTSEQRLLRAEQSLSDHGFSDLLVVDNFPIALVAYGFTRQSGDEHEATVRTFPPARRGSAKKPLYASGSNTEAVLLELDPLQVRDWLVDNTLLDGAVETCSDTSTVKAALLNEAAANTPAYEAVELLCHTLAHALIRNLGERAGFGQETMAEYLIPELLTIGLYANVHQEFTLGALISLVEHNLRSWFEASREGAQTCAWDPLCYAHEGACASCLQLAFGCERKARNEKLDRSVLFGSTDREREPYFARGFWE
jgi:hypothetical protein